MEFARQGRQRLSRFRLHVGGVDDCQLAGGQPLAHNKMQDFKGIVGRCLIILVIGH